ncbi:hypothetical protein JAAARDRAFT_580087 [Jaapia argillacea MUCL 33604]|uniref:Uncharacterized protein n=1 Tax=Jaapia argillacea MUCL 33604 TaxID=933084 RepID=A0A067P9T5_9AGAM|nr:hypothetical protein JAAARDRAFT_580087 [Jaapia argillacea MUCL 33604]
MKWIPKRHRLLPPQLASSHPPQFSPLWTWQPPPPVGIPKAKRPRQTPQQAPTPNKQRYSPLSDTQPLQTLSSPPHSSRIQPQLMSQQEAPIPDSGNTSLARNWAIESLEQRAVINRAALKLSFFFAHKTAKFVRRSFASTSPDPCLVLVPSSW